MLVLSRMEGEDIVIALPDGVEITVKQVAIRGQKSKLGIDAPPDVQVHRREIWERINGGTSDERPS